MYISLFIMIVFILTSINIVYAKDLLIYKNGMVNTSIPEYVIITHSAPKSQNYKINNGFIINRGTIRYVDKSENTNYIRLKSELNDTIRIYPQMKEIEVLHNYNAFDSFRYLLKDGDTLSITYYESTIPIAKILNRKHNDLELNYDYFWNKKIGKLNALSSYALYTHPYELVDKKSNISFKKQLKEIEPCVKMHLILDLKEECAFLDSLKLTKVISKEFYIYKKNNLYSISACFGFKDIPDSSNLFEANDIFTSEIDTLIKYEYYRRLLNRQLYKLRKVDKSTDIEVFHKIKTSINYGINVKRYMLRILLEDMKSKYSNIQFCEFVDEYLTITNDSVYARNVIQTKVTPNIKEWDILVADIDGKEKYFNDFIQSCKGKYIYIDFWATWCLPCKQLLKHNEGLQKQFPNIVFVCLAINDKISLWENEVTNNKELFPPTNYYIMNSKDSKVIDKLNISLIPRYILIDKQGEILNDNAPRPNSSEIHEILKQLK